jgi:pimeloyl-ACP methyl ester carboxylesterase
MKNNIDSESEEISIRKYGRPPFRVAVIHGGPGAPGYMAPVARELVHHIGVLEPLQTKASLRGQIEELENQLLGHAAAPVILVGSSWGSVLALFVAAGKKVAVGKLVLVGSAVFDAESSSRIEAIRLGRLSSEDRLKYDTIMQQLESAPPDKRDDLMNQWGELLDKSDIHDPLTTELEVIEVQHNIFSKVWPEFVALRDRPGYLENEFSKIEVPTVVIHGEYDPHPIEGIRPFLENCLSEISYHILPECGHYPWIERRARDRFYKILKDEIQKSS